MHVYACICVYLDTYTLRHKTHMCSTYVQKTPTAQTSDHREGVNGVQQICVQTWSDAGATPRVFAQINWAKLKNAMINWGMS